MLRFILLTVYYSNCVKALLFLSNVLFWLNEFSKCTCTSQSIHFSLQTLVVFVYLLWFKNNCGSLLYIAHFCVNLQKESCVSKEFLFVFLQSIAQMSYVNMSAAGLEPDKAPRNFMDDRTWESMYKLSML